MDEQDAWDDHTQSIVESRTTASPQHRFLSKQEAGMLSVMCSLLMNDQSPGVIRFMLHHFDETLHASPGESQRKQGVPPGKDLIRQGLQALEQYARRSFAASFLELENEAQKQLLQAVSQGKAEPASDWINAPQQPFFQKVLGLAVESYCSHPQVWSEIGYAGPAYPRGYVRVQLGQLDPWEAKKEL